MIKRTLYFSNPAYLKTKEEQLVIDLPERKEQKQVPLEDIGIVILDHPRITITHTVIAKLLHHNAALITCNETHHPTGLMLNLDGHTLQAQRFQHQVTAPVPLKKQLWQQTIQAKIRNQAALLKRAGIESKRMQQLATIVKSGDTTNIEATASVYYWRHFFPKQMAFFRERFGAPPNNLFNYGYAILRACVARSLVGSGLLPTLGIFHRNQYNAYCLADDIMEPYRPYIDNLVRKMVLEDGHQEYFLSTSGKQQLLCIPAMDVQIEGQSSPLMVAMQRTTASLARSFEERKAQVVYPILV
jgi:CRISPR-associated protein Cas1